MFKSLLLLPLDFLPALFLDLTVAGCLDRRLGRIRSVCMHASGEARYRGAALCPSAVCTWLLLSSIPLDVAACSSLVSTRAQLLSVPCYCALRGGWGAQGYTRSRLLLANGNKQACTHPSSARALGGQHPVSAMSYFSSLTHSLWSLCANIDELWIVAW